MWQLGKNAPMSLYKCPNPECSKTPEYLRAGLDPLYCEICLYVMVSVGG